MPGFCIYKALFPLADLGMTFDFIKDVFSIPNQFAANNIFWPKQEKLFLVHGLKPVALFVISKMLKH